MKKIKLLKSRYLLIFIIPLLTFSVDAANDIESIFDKYTSIKKPFTQRDPFQAPKMKNSNGRNNRFNQNKPGFLSNVPRLGNVKLDEIEIRAVLIGKNRRAIIRVADDQKQVYTIKEGMKLGENNSLIKAILPGGIVLVEKITNIYGEDEYIETVIPISK